MTLIYADGKHDDFMQLCKELDKTLDILVNGAFDRSVYTEYNALDDIHDVVVVYDNDVPIGCGSFKEYDAQTVEMKRLFVKPEYASKGLGAKIVTELETVAKKKGYTKSILETGERLQAACALYRKLGYKTIPNYGQYVDMDDSLCMGKTL